MRVVAPCGIAMEECVFCYNYTTDMAIPLLISNLINIHYLTGVKMTFGMVIMHSHTKLQLFVDSRYSEKAEKEAHRGVRVLSIDDLEKQVRKLKRLQFEA